MGSWIDGTVRHILNLEEESGILESLVNMSVVKQHLSMPKRQRDSIVTAEWLSLQPCTLRAASKV